MRHRSSVPMPAVGSSSSSTFGSSTSASAISSSFWSPCESVAAVRLRLPARPSSSIACSARSRVSARGKRRCSTAERRWSAQTAASIVSCTVSEGKMLATWNARPMPWRTISGGERPARSTPSSRIWPESGCSAPVIRLKKVLLPAPFGPITAVSEPSREIERDVIRRLDAAKRFRELADLEHGQSRSFAPSRRCAYHSSDKIHQALAQSDREEQDHDAEHDPVIFGQAGDGVVEDQQQTVPTIGPRKVVTPPSMLMKMPSPEIVQ